MNGQLWRDHPATPRQASYRHGSKRAARPTQADLLLDLLRNRRSLNQAITLPEIMSVGIAQHGARFNELRRRGFIIENELDRDPLGVVRSRYWLRFDPEKDGGGGR